MFRTASLFVAVSALTLTGTAYASLPSPEESSTGIELEASAELDSQDAQAIELEAVRELETAVQDAAESVQVANNDATAPIKSSGSGRCRSMSGVASWYGPGFHGRKTASGERFNTASLTAAHRTLPFNTHVRVTHSGTGRSVIVRINDRGPYAHGRVIDLSRAAAKSIGLDGTGRVNLETCL